MYYLFHIVQVTSTRTLTLYSRNPECISLEHSQVTPHCPTLVMVRLHRRARKQVGLYTIAAHIGCTRMCYEPRSTT